MTIADHWRAAMLLQSAGEKAGFTPLDAESVESSITAYFRRQAERYPSRVAISMDQSDTTYEALQRTAGRIAAVVARHGRSNVALLCQSGAGAVAAMLGVLNAGRAYVPLDPSFPAMRLQQIVDDVEADLIIADRAGYAAAVPLRRHGVSLLVTDEIESGPDASYAVDVEPDALAYILYTSGSTGTPKGVAQSHRNLLHFIRSYTNSLRIGPLDRLSLVCPLSFSAALMDIYGSILKGAALCPFDVKRRGSAGLADWIDREGITVFHSVPTLFRQLTLSLEPSRRLATVRAIDLGGETVYARDIEMYRAHFSRDCVLINHLACSEVSVLAQYYIDQNCDVGASGICAGPVADGVKVRVVGPDGELLPVGEIGELVIESRYVSPGSWREWRSARADGAGREAFHTGDLARMGADGMLEYLGRRGSRVKIRGYSIEPLEVERALLEVDGIREAIVLDRPAPGDGNAAVLVAYVTSRNGQRIGVETLRRELAARLPEFMVPSKFVYLESLPLTTSGKIDRQALPAWTGQRPELEQAFIAPGSDLECRLAVIWGELLGMDRVGIDDDFFALGGDSFSAVQLVVRIEEELGRSIPSTGLITAPTVRQLAAGMMADNESIVGEWQCVHDADGRRPPLFCLPGIGGTGFGFRELCARIDPERSAFTLRYPGVYGREAPLRRVDALAERAIAGLRSIQDRGPYHLCGYSFGGLVAYEMACRLCAGGDEVAFLALLDTRGPGLKPRPVGQRLLAHARHLRVTRDKLGYVKEHVAAAYARRTGRNELSAWSPPDPYLPTAAVREVAAACIEAARVYRPGLYPDRASLYPGRATVLRTHDPGLDFWQVDPQFGWGDVVRGGVDVADISIRHDALFQPPHVGVVAQCLSQALVAAAARRRGSEPAHEAGTQSRHPSSLPG